MQKLQKTKKNGYKYIIGIDEVGRGPVAGPVAVCASLINFGMSRSDSQKIRKIFNDKKLPALRDSKKLSEKGRDSWFDFVINNKIEFSLSYASAKEIDKKGIAVCIRALIKKNLESLKTKVNFKYEEVLVLLDGGLKAPEEYINQETIIKGDDKEPIISFASIYAKVSRDRLMTKLSKKFPEYLFEKHKGYGTKNHMEAIKAFGVSKHHRASFLKRLV